MKIIAITQKGIHKTENEDRIIVGEAVLTGGTLSCEMESGILAVADGVGGIMRVPLLLAMSRTD